MYVFLPALLFEGAWNVKLDLLRKNWRVIFFLAGPGLLFSLVIIAALLHLVDGLDWMTAFLLAAILSPTDPVAVLGLFRQLHVNERLANIIEGESLFNDGVAGSLYQVFLMLVLLGLHNTPLTGWPAIGTGILQLLIEAGGGIVFGILSGALISQGLKRIDDPRSRRRLPSLRPMVCSGLLIPFIYPRSSRLLCWAWCWVIMGAIPLCPKLQAETWIPSGISSPFLATP
ncbi:hypothetical protein KDW_46860 [Dictyobacter vulcani]|uniref:Cation/H+ exchanger transmembrane domain-containing protein n=1 Tax=Dictyobacter vulcani TaxID=2607529 RepID=A0A5J4KMC8_9CHLR|nr:hypothetical protein KDW_46860 [Dictyobacter vulcani]